MQIINVPTAPVGAPLIGFTPEKRVPIWGPSPIRRGPILPFRRRFLGQSFTTDLFSGDLTGALTSLTTPSDTTSISPLMMIGLGLLGFVYFYSYFKKGAKSYKRKARKRQQKQQQKRERISALERDFYRHRRN